MGSEARLQFNDGLVLGMKGTFAQAELHIIRTRLHGGKLNKAHKGELRFPLPVGFVWDGDKIVLDPDQEVQGAVRSVFKLFEKEGTAYAVVRSFNDPRSAYRISAPTGCHSIAQGNALGDQFVSER